MIRIWTSIIVAFFLSAGPILHAQTPSPSLATVLEQKLSGNLLALRIPSATNKLHFDTTGLPVGKQEHGVASLDRDILVKSIKVTDSTVKIAGERVYRSWDPVRNQFVSNLPQIKVEVFIDLPDADSSEAAIAPAFKKIFLSASESEQRRCSPTEAAASHPFLTDWLYKVSAVPRPSAASKSDLDSICFPSGDRG